MKVLLLSNEYPPHIYGGAGIHVSYLSRELAKLCRVEVRCFGKQKVHEKTLKVRGFPPSRRKGSAPKPLKSVFDAVQRNNAFNMSRIDADIVHVHTWYTHFAGILAKLNYSIPLVVTTHSLEPLRPWKREQLGGGYDFSCWVEKTALEMADAVVAVSEETRQDILGHFQVSPEKIHIIHNGIDPKEYTPTRSPRAIESLGIDLSRPYVLFVGRITRQKGIFHLLNAIPYLKEEIQVVFCASAADTPQILLEMEEHVAAVEKARGGIIWIKNIIDLQAKVALYSHAAVFCCPSVYEPFGIINLEAMACETPVVASAVGGIKEAVADGETGILVPVKNGDSAQMKAESAKAFEKDLARAINQLVDDKALRRRMGKAGRRRVLKSFSWAHVARETHALYRSLLSELTASKDKSISSANRRRP